jgi:hypothetical protein
MSEAEEGMETARLVLGEICRRLTVPRNSVTDTSVHAAQKDAPWDACVSHRVAASILPAHRKYRSISHRCLHINPQNCANVISSASNPQ